MSTQSQPSLRDCSSASSADLKGPNIAPFSSLVSTAMYRRSITSAFVLFERAGAEESSLEGFHLGCFFAVLSKVLGFDGELASGCSLGEVFLIRPPALAAPDDFIHHKSVEGFCQADAGLRLRQDDSLASFIFGEGFWQVGCDRSGGCVGSLNVCDCGGKVELRLQKVALENSATEHEQLGTVALVHSNYTSADCDLFLMVVMTHCLAPDGGFCFCCVTDFLLITGSSTENGFALRITVKSGFTANFFLRVAAAFLAAMLRFAFRSFAARSALRRRAAACTRFTARRFSSR